MTKAMIEINEEKCIGCGLCVNACQQSVIKLENGKAKVVQGDFCDGLGKCLPVCPVDAIRFLEKSITKDIASVPFVCPSKVSKSLNGNMKSSNTISADSELRQWPVQIKLVPINAPYFDNAQLLIAADCTAYAYGGFHNEFMHGRVTLIGCPKLDEGNYTEKLSAIITNNNIENITVIRMQVPCCGGIESAVKNALQNSEKNISLKVVTISVDGDIVKN